MFPRPPATINTATKRKFQSRRRPLLPAGFKPFALCEQEIVRSSVVAFSVVAVHSNICGIITRNNNNSEKSAKETHEIQEITYLIGKIGLVALEPRQPGQENALHALQPAEDQGHVHVAVGVVAGRAEQSHGRGEASLLGRAHVIESRRGESTLLRASVEEGVVAGQVVQHRGQVAGPRGDQIPLHVVAKSYRQGSVWPVLIRQIRLFLPELWTTTRADTEPCLGNQGTLSTKEQRLVTLFIRDAPLCLLFRIITFRRNSRLKLGKLARSPRHFRTFGRGKIGDRPASFPIINRPFLKSNQETRSRRECLFGDDIFQRSPVYGFFKIFRSNFSSSIFLLFSYLQQMTTKFQPLPGGIDLSRQPLLASI